MKGCSERGVTMGAALPILKTKRFLYDVMVTRLSKLDAYAARNNDAYEDSATAILGVRQIGKTVLLKQLYNVAPDISEYRDCTDLPSDFDFDGYLRKLLDSGIKRLFLDEVCKIQRDSLADLIRFIKDACAFMSVTFTGSTKQAVEALSADACRGISVELPPIMYIERLAWAQSKEVCSLTGEDLLRMSSIDAFARYLNVNKADEEACLSNDLCAKSGYCYQFVNDCGYGKIDELDVAYMTGFYIGSRKGGIEAKWRPYSEINNVNYLSRCIKIAKALELNELAVSCKDKNWVVPPALAKIEAKDRMETIICRADLLHLALELGYIEVLERGSCFSTKTVLELMRHFGLDKTIE